MAVTEYHQDAAQAATRQHAARLAKPLRRSSFQVPPPGICTLEMPCFPAVITAAVAG